MIDTLLPAGGGQGSPPGALEAGLDEFLDEFARTADIRLRRAFQLALIAATWVAPVLIRRLPPLARLSSDERERALQALAGSGFLPFRQLVVVLKAVVSLGYGAHPRVREVIGDR